MQIKFSVFLFSLLWMVLPVGVAGQEEETGDEVFIVVESPLEFPGGQMEMMKYIAAHVEYPDEAANQGVTGRVMIQFVVNTDGSISHIKLLRSVHPLLDSAAVKVIRDMPLWTPGNQRNKPVPVRMVVPVNFSLATEPPDKARKWGIQGKVVVQFIVKTDGSLADVKIHSTEHDLLNEEALCVVRIMPNWVPARKKGKPVEAVYYLPIHFVLIH